LHTCDVTVSGDRSPSDSQSDTCRRAVNDDVKSNNSRDCCDVTVVAAPYGGWTTENTSPDKINFRSMTTSSGDASLPLCMVNGSPSKRHLANNVVINDHANSTKLKCFGNDLNQYNGKVRDVINCGCYETNVVIIRFLNKLKLLLA